VIGLRQGKARPTRRAFFVPSLRLCASAAILLLSPVAGAQETIALVDGTELAGATLLDGDKEIVRVRIGEEIRALPATSLVAVRRAAAAAAEPEGGFNLFLRDGDRLRGRVRGEGEVVVLDSPRVSNFRAPLDAVRGLRFGRIVALHLQAKYAEAFARELERGRDSIVALRDDRPTPVGARVTHVGEDALTAYVGAREQSLALAKVYGFVRAVGEAPAPSGLRVRVHLAGGERLTLLLERITKETIEGGGTAVFRKDVTRLEFLGDHVGHLSDMDPIDVKQRALFGEPPPWQRDRMALGGPLRMGGATYARGLGTQSHTRLEFVLAGRWSSFFVRCGIDDVAGREADALFRITGDGKVLREVRRRHGDAPAEILVDVSGVDRLVLEALPGESYISDFCDWADARVFRRAK